jgi:hypothetical protein
MQIRRPLAIREAVTTKIAIVLELALVLDHESTVLLVLVLRA